MRLTAQPRTELQRRTGVLSAPPPPLGSLDLRHQLHGHVLLPAQAAAQEVCGGLSVPQLSAAVAAHVGMVVRGDGRTAQAAAQHHGAQQRQRSQPALCGVQGVSGVCDTQQHGAGVQHGCAYTQGVQSIGLTCLCTRIACITYAYAHHIDAVTCTHMLHAHTLVTHLDTYSTYITHLYTHAYTYSNADTRYNMLVRVCNTRVDITCMKHRDTSVQTQHIHCMQACVTSTHVCTYTHT